MDAVQKSLDRLRSATKSQAKPRIVVRQFAGPAAFKEQLSHLRVVHLTDQHVGRITPLKTQLDAVARANEQKPDLVVITGDFVCHSQAYLDQLAQVVKAFDAPVMGVLGNHDHWSGAKEVCQTLTGAGVEMLNNAHTVIHLRGQALQVVGLDDAYTGHANRQKATKGLRPDLPTIGLSHIAEQANGLWAKGIPLVLSGHTHAGQITLAGLHEIALGKMVGHQYVHGLYGSRKSVGPRPAGAVYVGAGIGASVMPFRLGERAQSEITVFELGHAPAVFHEHHDEQQPLLGRKPSAKIQARRTAKVRRKQVKRERQAKQG
ncbi:MAG: metallophosphoesterase [Myxococcales bacterium]|nr:metallophosphoesterase [Myxococcales bacterium]MCB9709510.1 metallophosphoesterase [Myxococcales bacterium]